MIRQRWLPFNDWLITPVAIAPHVGVKLPPPAMAPRLRSSAPTRRGQPLRQSLALLGDLATNTSALSAHLTACACNGCSGAISASVARHATQRRGQSYDRLSGLGRPLARFRNHVVPGTFRGLLSALSCTTLPAQRPLILNMKDASPQALTHHATFSIGVVVGKALPGRACRECGGNSGCRRPVQVDRHPQSKDRTWMAKKFTVWQGSGSAKVT